MITYFLSTYIIKQKQKQIVVQLCENYKKLDIF